MKVSELKSLTVDELRGDIQHAVNEEFGMNVPDFLHAVSSGNLQKDDVAVREILLWLRFVPTNDKLFKSCPSST